jgi:hypothetical protein
MAGVAKHVPMLECISIHRIQSLPGEYPINFCLRMRRAFSRFRRRIQNKHDNAKDSRSVFAVNTPTKICRARIVMQQYAVNL